MRISFDVRHETSRKSCWCALLFCPLNAGLEVAFMQPIPLLLLASLFCARGTILCPIGTGDEAAFADNAAACGFVSPVDGSFQLRITRQHRIPEPFAVQRQGEPLGTSVAFLKVYCLALTLMEVTASLPNETSHLRKQTFVEADNLSHDQTPAGTGDVRRRPPAEPWHRRPDQSWEKHSPSAGQLPFPAKALLFSYPELSVSA